MVDEQLNWNDRWSIALRVELQRRARAVLGRNSADLLAAIQRTRSISAAARELAISYRHAWMIVQEMNRAAGQPLVVAAVGGRAGGGAQVTAPGQVVLRLFEELEAALTRSTAQLLPQLVRVSSETPALHVAAAISLQEVVGQLLADYTLFRPAIRARVVFGASNELADRILAGAETDLFLTADDQHLRRLASAGLLVAKSRRKLALNTLAAIAPADRATNVRKPQDLLRSEVKRIALAEAASPLGQFTRAYLEKLDLYERLASRAVQVDNARAVVSAVEAGQADVGIAYTSDAARPGCQVLFRVPAGRASVEYTAAVVRTGSRAEDARELLDFMCRAESQHCWRRCGFKIPARRARCS